MDQPTLQPDTEAVLEHWKSLRDADLLVPSLDAWLQNLPAWIAPHQYRAELQADDISCLFSGSVVTERRGGDMTGKSMLPPEPGLRAATLAYVRTIVSHPCCAIANLAYPTSMNRFLEVQTILLPLDAGPGR